MPASAATASHEGAGATIAHHEPLPYRPPYRNAQSGSDSECPECLSAVANQRCGLYRFGCIGCCVRLVASARPSRRRQEAMLAAIGRYSKSPDRQEIIDFLNPNSSAKEQQ